MLSSIFGNLHLYHHYVLVHFTLCHVRRSILVVVYITTFMELLYVKYLVIGAKL